MQKNFAPSLKNLQKDLEAYLKSEGKCEKNEPYNLICLDMLMPGLSGQEVLQAVRQYESDLQVPPLSGAKVIFVTGDPSTRSVTEAFRKGCEGYLIKPIDKAKLLQAVEKLGLLA